MGTLICFISVSRKYELYSMDWDLKEELKDCLVAAAPYGGPIGMLPLLLLHTVGSQGDALGCSLPILLLNVFSLGSHKARFPWAEPA